MYKEKSLERLSQLIDLGQKLYTTLKHPGPNVITQPWVDRTLFAQWRTSSLNFLKTVFGENSSHYTEFLKKCTGNGQSYVDEGNGILKSAEDDIKSGFLKRIESMVSAEIFTDFMEMAEYLHAEGYHIPAASLAGAVLEDSLKKICVAHELEVKRSDRLATLNEKLHTSHVYNKIVWKNIDTWREIRNAADHGSFEEFTPEQVNAMVSGISDFMGRYLA